MCFVCVCVCVCVVCVCARLCVCDRCCCYCFLVPTAARFLPAARCLLPAADQYRTAFRMFGSPQDGIRWGANSPSPTTPPPHTPHTPTPCNGPRVARSEVVAFAGVCLALPCHVPYTAAFALHTCSPPHHRTHPPHPITHLPPPTTNQPSREDLKFRLRSMNIVISDSEIERMFHMTDLNQNGKLEFSVSAAVRCMHCAVYGVQCSAVRRVYA